MKKTFIPKSYQSTYPLSQRVLKEIPSGEKIEFDILFVGAGPASLSSAIRMKQLNPNWEIGILEKASRLGGHSLSGAVINPIAFQKLFPNTSAKDWPVRLPVQKEKMYFLTKKYQIRLPVPWTMSNHKFYTASLCEIVRFLGEKAEQLGVHLFTNTAAEKLIIKEGTVLGVQTTASGLNRDSRPGDGYQEPITLLAKTTLLTDGVRGNLSSAYLRQNQISSHYPSQYALGIKEVWKVKKTPNSIIHTVGWPLSGFGGSWLYPLSKEHVSIGLVSGMDAKTNTWNLNKDFQNMKQHPLFQSVLHQGECLEWGAKAIPEGGFYSIPKKISGKGVMILGDAAGLVNVPSLKGIHYAMLSGIEAAEFLFQKEQGKNIDSFEKILTNHPLIGRELHKVRNVRQAFQTPFGFIKATLMMITGGRFPGDFQPHTLKNDAEVKKTIQTTKTHSPSKDNFVYLSGNKTRDDIPPHLKTSENLESFVEDFYIHFCPAGVYERKNGKFIVKSPNCIDCKATDILGPWWNPREGGSGPDYHLM